MWAMGIKVTACAHTTDRI